MDKTNIDAGRVVDSSRWIIPLIITFVAMVGLVLGLLETAVAVVTFWWDSSQYSYSFLVVAVSAYLIWQHRTLFSHLSPVPSILGLATLVGLSILWFVSRIVDVVTVEYVSFIMMFPVLIWGMLGNQIAKIIFFPLGYFIFAAPIWDPIAPLLQDMTAIVVYKVLQFQGIPTFMEGYYLTIPEGRFLIEEVCGGLRFLLASMALGALYVYLFFERNRQRFFIFSVIVCWSIALNWLRVLIIIWIGHLTDMQHPMVEDHEGLGWAIYAGLMYPLLWVLLPKRKQVNKAVGKNESANQAITHTVYPLRREYIYGGALALLATLIVMLKGVELRFDSSPELVNPVRLALPSTSTEWIGPEYKDSGWQPTYQGADKTLVAEYRKANHTVMLYVAHYAHQRQGAELINSENGFFTEAHEVVIEHGQHTIADSESRKYQVSELEIRAENKKLIWYWYDVGGMPTTSTFVAKLLEVWGAINANRSASVIAISVNYDQEAEAARTILSDFYMQIVPRINEKLDDLSS